MLSTSRLFASLTAVLVLSGCTNIVVSDEPWFPVSAYAADGPLRDGVWAELDGSCEYDSSLSVDQWPECASWFVVRGQQLLRYVGDQEEVDEEGVPTRYRWVVQNVAYDIGDLLIVQTPNCPTSEEVAPDAQEPEGGDEIQTANFCYSVMAPTRLSAEGRIIAADQWTILCGPFRDDEDEARVFWPGLIGRGDNCTAESAAALRNAARLSRDSAETRIGYSNSISWVREGHR